MSKRSIVTVAGLAVVLAATIAAPSVAGNESQDERDQRALASARSLANANGEASPESAEIMYTDRRAATSWIAGAPTNEGDPDREVAVTILRGRFIGHFAKVPAGRDLPTGTHLIVVTDADTGEITDWNLRTGLRSNPPAEPRPVDPNG